MILTYDERTSGFIIEEVIHGVHFKLIHSPQGVTFSRGETKVSLDFVPEGVLENFLVLLEETRSTIVQCQIALERDQDAHSGEDGT